MTTLGSSALCSLVIKVASQSDTVYGALSYMNMAIAVCGVVAALIVLAGPGHRKGAGGAEPTEAAYNDAAEELKALARQLRWADNRSRLLAVAERFN
jgi:hypothetical protein